MSVPGVAAAIHHVTLPRSRFCAPSASHRRTRSYADRGLVVDGGNGSPPFAALRRQRLPAGPSAEIAWALLWRGGVGVEVLPAPGASARVSPPLNEAAVGVAWGATGQMAARLASNLLALDHPARRAQPGQPGRGHRGIVGGEFAAWSVPCRCPRSASKERTP